MEDEDLSEEDGANSEEDEDGSGLPHGIGNFYSVALVLVPAAQQRLILQPLLEMPRKLKGAVVIVAAAQKHAMALKAGKSGKQVSPQHNIAMQNHIGRALLQSFVE